MTTPPTPFGRYVLQERLAQGGMGEVFRAVAVGEHGFEKPVVVKRVLPAHAGREDLAELFIAEAKLMTRLAHPNIVEVYDFGRGEHRDYYLVLELVDGVDLGRLLRAYAARGEAFPAPLALHVTAQVLRGLHHAHTRLEGEGITIVHRDVSPSNVLLSTEGEVKVADFGIALVQGDLGGVAGKPGYMAPEQFAGGRVDPRADVFSVGVVLAQMLAGRSPFTGETPEAQQAAAARGDRAPLGRFDVGEAVEAIVARALSPEVDGRFPSARAMAQAIEGLREAGQALASADDLADAVRAAKRELPVEGRRVIALSSPVPVEEEPRELTRTGGMGGAFTLRFPVRADATTRQADEGAARREDRFAGPEPRTERIEIGDRSGEAIGGSIAGGIAGEERARDRDPPRARIGIVIAGVAAVLVGAIAAWWRPAPRPPAMPALPPVTTAPSADPPAVTASSADPPAPIATASSEAAPVPSASEAASAHPASPRVAPRTAATASAAPAAGDDCTGKVHFSSQDSWEIAGGPARAQTPGFVVWRCGTYALTARYRPDPTQARRVTVTVRPDRTAEVTLRLP